jgi:hypothetical protein
MSKSDSTSTESQEKPKLFGPKRFSTPEYSAAANSETNLKLRDIVIRANDLVSNVAAWLDEGHGAECPCTWCVYDDCEQRDDVCQTLSGLHWALWAVVSIAASNGFLYMRTPQDLNRMVEEVKAEIEAQKAAADEPAIAAAK